MTDRAPMTEPSAPRRRRAPPRAASREEALALAERAASLRDGVALLERGALECVAVLLGVDARLVERVRVALEDPALRDEVARHHARAAGAHRPPASGPPASPEAPRDPEALLAAARAREGGLALLLGAAPECAAIAFGVHPALVHAAREAAARAGLAPGAPR